MAFFKRIFLFLIVNILIITTISIILNLLNVKPFSSGSRIGLSISPNLLLDLGLWWSVYLSWAFSDDGQVDDGCQINRSDHF
jgi:hypothetical protein